MKAFRWWPPLAILAIALLFLLSPAVLPENETNLCCKDLRLTPALGFPLNCDSQIFLGLAADPGALFDGEGAGWTWQSRPLFIGAAALSRAWVLTALDFLGVHPHRVRHVEIAGWLGYVLLNFLLLTAALRLFQRSFENVPVPAAALAAAMTFLAANHVVKTYFWTPHTQILNIFLPVLAILLTARALDSSVERRSGSETGLLLLLGFCSLAYGSFLAAGAAVAIAGSWRQYRLEPLWPGAFVESGKRLALVLLPSLAWVAWFRLRLGGFYSRETEQYHEFVWPWKALQEGLPALVRKAADFQDRFFEVTFAEIAIPLALLVLVLVVALREKFDPAQMAPASNRLVRASLIVLTINAAFYAGLGFYSGRLSWNLYPEILTIVLVLGAELVRGGKLPRETLNRAAIALGGANFLYWWIRPGPYV